MTEVERGKKGHRWEEEMQGEKVWGSGERKGVRPRHGEG